MASLQVNRFDSLRQCYVDGKRGIFHCWSHGSKPIIKIGCRLNQNDREWLYDRICHAPIIGTEFEAVDIMKTVFGIVEFEDGSVKLVDPEQITFVDGGEMFEEWFWPEIKSLEDDNS